VIFLFFALWTQEFPNNTIELVPKNKHLVALETFDVVKVVVKVVVADRAVQEALPCEGYI
jgi:hypothetical protein